MSDRVVREASRAAATGAVEEAADSLAARVRAGELLRWQVELAAYCGDQAAVLVAGNEAARWGVVPLHFLEWWNGLWLYSSSGGAPLRAALVASWMALAAEQLEHRAVIYDAWRALRAIEDYAVSDYDTPEEVRRGEWDRWLSLTHDLPRWPPAWIPCADAIDVPWREQFEEHDPDDRCQLLTSVRAAVSVLRESRGALRLARRESASRIADWVLGRGWRRWEGERGG